MRGRVQALTRLIQASSSVVSRKEQNCIRMRIAEGHQYYYTKNCLSLQGDDEKMASFGRINHVRLFSSDAGVTVPAGSPPSEITEDIAKTVQRTTAMYVKYGLTHQQLVKIGMEQKDRATLIHRWQRMMEAFLAAQVHVLAGLGYEPNEKGLNQYNQHLTALNSTMDPTTQTELQEVGRDLWRHVLVTAFGISIEEIKNKQMSIVDARNIMHKVATRMNEPEILEMVAKRASEASAGAPKGQELAAKHTVLQDILVNNVYLGGEPCLVKECGFGDGEQGYVLMQYTMTEHQTDPLIAQYIGGAMMRLIQAAGLSS